MKSHFLQQENQLCWRESCRGYKGLSETVTLKLRPIGICWSQKGRKSIAGENLEPEINSDSSRKQKIIQMSGRESWRQREMKTSRASRGVGGTSGTFQMQREATGSYPRQCSVADERAGSSPSPTSWLGP